MLSMIAASTLISFFFFNDTATTEIYTLSLHDALPISARAPDRGGDQAALHAAVESGAGLRRVRRPAAADQIGRHTSELQSQSNLVCRLLLEKKKKHHELFKPRLVSLLLTLIPDSRPYS